MPPVLARVRSHAFSDELNICSAPMDSSSTQFMLVRVIGAREHEPIPCATDGGNNGDCAHHWGAGVAASGEHTIVMEITRSWNNRRNAANS